MSQLVVSSTPSTQQLTKPNIPDMKWLVIILLCILYNVSLGSYVTNSVERGSVTRSLNRSDQKYDPDIDLTTPNIIRRHGYPSESHVVQTGDGYLLTLHRIPRSREQRDSRPRPVVFLQHGLLASSADWIISGPGKALGYILSDSGYDVWFGNARGNTYSRSHVSLSINDAAYWDFSFHEMGVYDLPAAIDHVLNATGQPSLYYVGHSMGTTMFYVFASQRPDLHRTVKAMYSLAPVAYVGHVQSPIRLLAPWIDDIEFLARFLGASEFLPQNKMIAFLARFGCELDATEKKICENALFVLCGYDDLQFNETLLPLILSHTPAGTATKVLVHFAQEIRSGKFQQFDHGEKGNQVAYNQSSPPEYDFRKIQIPVALHVADNDWLASKQDVMSLSQQLPQLIGTYDVPFPSFNHLDFLWGKDAKTLVYDTVLQLMKNLTMTSKTAMHSGTTD